MHHPDDSLIPEQRARAIWHRAAQLQAEAAQRMEERSRALARRSEADATTAGGGFHQAEVEAAAVEAGIGAEFVQLAMAELAEAGEPPERLHGWQGRAASRVISPERSIRLSRAVAAPPAQVLAALQRVLPSHPYQLALRDVVGGHPLEGGILVFDPPPYSWWNLEGASTFAYHAVAIDLGPLRVSLRPLGGEGGEATGCEVELNTDLHHGVRRNWRFALGTGGLIGAFGGLLGGAAGTVLLPAALAALPAAAAFAAVGATTVVGYGALWRRYHRKTVKLLQELLQRVDANARTGGAFVLPQPGRADGSAPVGGPLLS